MKTFLIQWEATLKENKETVVLSNVNMDWLCCVSKDVPALSKADRHSARTLLSELDRQRTTHGEI